MIIKLNWNASIKREFCKWAQKGDLYHNDPSGYQTKYIGYMDKIHVNVMLKNNFANIMLNVRPS